MSYTLGVDLGTTWTAAVVDDGEHARPLELGDQGPAIASVIARDGDAFVFGSAAERQILVAPASGAREVKRRVGDSAPIIVAGVPYGADALLGALVQHVVSVATEEMNAPPDRVVLTHPASWGEYKLDVLRDAAKNAGVDNVELLPEPTAAAMHYATLGKIEPDEAVAVYDFGGGTFDAAVLRRKNGGFELLGTPEGIERLGGIDLDQAVLAHVDAALDEQLHQLDRSDPEVRQSLARLRDECVRAKEALSADTETTIPVDVPGVRTSVRLTRAELEAMVRPRLDDTVTAMQRTLTSAELGWDDIASVLLVGGSSRIPVVAEVVGAMTGRPTTIDAHPKLVVASGAASPRVLAADDEHDDGDGATVAGERDDDENGAREDSSARAAASTSTPKGSAPKDREREPRERASRRSRLGGGAAVAAAVGVVAGAAAAADAAFGSDSASAATTAPPTDAREEHERGHDAQPDTTARDPRIRAPETDPQRAEPHDGGRGAAGTAPPEGATLAASARAHLVGSEAPRVMHRAAAPEAPGVQHARVEVHEPQAAAGAPNAPAPAEHAPPDPFEQYRDDLMHRLESWSGPPGASPDEVAHLREELAGVIDRAVHAPGQPLEAAQADLEDRLDDKLHIYEQDHKLDVLAMEEQREAQQHATELASEQRFGEYQKSLADTTQNWHPAWWGDQGPHDDAALADLKARVSAVLVGMQYDPNKPVFDQENALHDTVKGLMLTFQNEAYQKYNEDVQATFNKREADSYHWEGGLGVAERNHINSERTMFADEIAKRLNEDSTNFDPLPVPQRTQEELEASAERIAQRYEMHQEAGSGLDPSQMRTMAMGDAFDHASPDTPVDPMHQHDVLGTSGEGAHPADVEHGPVAFGGHAAPSVHDDDFLGSAAATEHLGNVVASMTTPAPDAHDPMPADAMHAPNAAEPAPMTAEAHDSPFAVSAHPGPVVETTDAMHHDPGVLVHEPDHHPSDHGIIMQHHDATNPFADHDPTAPPDHDEAPVLTMPDDDPAPVMPNPDDDLP